MHCSTWLIFCTAKLDLWKSSVEGHCKHWESRPFQHLMPDYMITMIMTNMLMKLIAFVLHSFFYFPPQMSFQMLPQKTCPNGCKITLFGVVGFFASGNFQLVLPIACLHDIGIFMIFHHSEFSCVSSDRSLKQMNIHISCIFFFSFVFFDLQSIRRDWLFILLTKFWLSKYALLT